MVTEASGQVTGQDRHHFSSKGRQETVSCWKLGGKDLILPETLRGTLDLSEPKAQLERLSTLLKPNDRPTGDRRKVRDQRKSSVSLRSHQESTGSSLHYAQLT